MSKDIVLETLGLPHPGNLMRDAVHIAVVTGQSTVEVKPGQRLMLMMSGSVEYFVPVKKPAEPIGIVDPFRTEPIPAGECFWVLLMPRTITGLRHEWQHPSFPSAPTSVVTTQITRDIFDEVAEIAGITRKRLWSALEGYVDGYMDYMPMGTNEDYKDISSEMWNEMWDEWIRQGHKAPPDRHSFFSCSC